MTTTPVSSFPEMKQAMRAAWMAGDFGVIAKTMARDAEAFVQRIAVQPGMSVLDVACGTGNLAIPLARAGAVVTGVDIATNLLEQARQRAANEGLAAQFDEGDAERLPYPDASFDVAVTMFGAMFAPRPAIVAAELARVLKPGGRVAMANWTPESFANRMFLMNARHVPPPAGYVPPILWGDETTVYQRLEKNFVEIGTEVIPLLLDMPVSPVEAVTFFMTNFGPTQAMLAKLDEGGKAAFQADFVALWTAENTADDREGHTRIPNEYLQVLATRR